MKGVYFLMMIIIIIIIAINIVFIIVKMIVELSPLFQNLAILLLIFAIYLSHWNLILSIEIKELMLNCLA